ncbi:MAG: double-cubane-cluster-containing anaerobic reductase [Desulfosporosinus sp.]
MSSASIDKFMEFGEQNMSALINAKENGLNVVGTYCSYCPRELILAAGAVPVGLCGTSENPIPAAEKELPRNLCPLIKSSYGFAVSDTCPYFHFSDLIVGETTCDGKKKMFELLQRLKTVHIMHLPQLPDRQSSSNLWYEEIVQLKEALEKRFALQITEAALRRAIHTTNQQIRAKLELFDLNRNKPSLISGMDLVKVSAQTKFCIDQQESILMTEQLVAELREKAAKGYCVGDLATPRILLTGTPVGLGSEKVVALVEECGGQIVVMQTCGGYNIADLQVEESDPRDPLILLAEKYLKIPCSVMSPNERRLDLLNRMINDFQIDGVIDLTWQACHTFNVESFLVEEFVKNKVNLPFLHIETDYSNSDRENLRVRIEAFLEIIMDQMR